MRLLMDWLRGIGVKLKTLLRPEAAWKDLDDELRFHLEMEAARLRREGMAPEEARRQAMAHFGGVERIKDETREARGTKIPLCQR